MRLRLVYRSWAPAGAGAAAVREEEPLPPKKVTQARWADAVAEWRSQNGPERPRRTRAGNVFARQLSFLCRSRHLADLMWTRAQAAPGTKSHKNSLQRTGSSRQSRTREVKGAFGFCKPGMWLLQNGHLAALQQARTKRFAWDCATCPRVNVRHPGGLPVQPPEEEVRALPISKCK